MADRKGTSAEPRPDQSERCVRRVLYEGDPREADYLNAHAEVEAIRSELAELRGRLRDVARTESYFWFDSMANSAAGALSTAIVALYSLVEGDRSLRLRAGRSRDLWADVEACPEAYVVRPGTSRAAERARG